MRIEERDNSSYDWNELHFVLVHGASHGGWCWYKLRTLLEAEGHKVTAVDLASAGINPTPYYNVLTFSQYNYPLTTLMDSLPAHQKVVIVGHSLGGMNVTDVLHKFPRKISVAVYIAANMKKEGQNLSQMLPASKTQIDLKWEVLTEPGHEEFPGIILKPEYQRNYYYNMSSVEASTLAGSLLRPCPMIPLQNVAFKPTKGGLSVPRVFVKTLKDQLMSQSNQEDMIAQWPPCKVYAIGSDHCAMISTPTQLARILIEAATLAQQYI